VVGSCSTAFLTRHGELLRVKKIMSTKLKFSTQLKHQIKKKNLENKIADKILASNSYLKCNFQIREHTYKIVITDTL